MSMLRKVNGGQMAMEFVMMLAIAAIIGILFIASLSNILSDKGEERRIRALNDIGYMIQDEVILATQVEDGYRRVFTIPQKASYFKYTITNTPTGVILSSGRTIITYPVPVVDGSFVKGDNTLTKNGKVTVS